MKKGNKTKLQIWDCYGIESEEHWNDLPDSIKEHLKRGLNYYDACRMARIDRSKRNKLNPVIKKNLVYEKVEAKQVFEISVYSQDKSLTGALYYYGNKLNSNNLFKKSKKKFKSTNRLFNLYYSNKDLKKTLDEYLRRINKKVDKWITEPKIFLKNNNLIIHSRRLTKSTDISQTAIIKISKNVKYSK